MQQSEDRQPGERHKTMIYALRHSAIFEAGNRSDDRALVSMWYLFEESPGSGGQAAR